MFLTVLVSVVVTLWILFCAALYGYHYLIEVTLDLPISGPSPYSPCTAHAALKKIIENILKECGNLPALEKAQDNRANSPQESNRTYEDLLATAILNKVISTNQNNIPYSSANSVSSRHSTSSRHRDNKEYFFGEETLETKWKTTDLDTTSVSSIEEWLHSESSYGSKKYVDHMTLTIKQDIEEVYQTDSEAEDEVDDTEHFRPSSSLLNEDEANWFLKKRQFQGTHSPVPVPMLVPDPTTEAKVLIGDKELDDTSDLSDVASDYGESEPLPGRHSLLIESKTLIGGKNTLDLCEDQGRESGSSSDSGVKEVNGKVSRMDDLHRAIPVMTDITVDDDNVEDSSILSVYSNTEKDADYTERYASLPRTVFKPTPPSRKSLENELNSESPEPSNFEQQQLLVSYDNGFDDQDDCKSEHSEFEGSYSKREKEKWKHAVEMKNNPYSKENIEKRIKRSNSSTSSMFGPEYYIRQASMPGGGKQVPETGPAWARTQTPEPKIEEDNSNEHIHINGNYNTNEENIISEPQSISNTDDDVFTSLNSSNNYNSYSVTEIPEPKYSASEITSDSDISYINYYDVENGKVYKQSKNGIQVIVPEPKMFVPQPIENNNNMNQKYKALSEDELDSKPREGLFSKSTNTRKTFPPKYNEDRPNLRRHKSESDLLEDDSFDRKPTVLHKRKDNTLISKIYLDPKVKNFALHQRDQLPVENTETRPTFRTQVSLTPVNQTKKSSISSDEGLLSDHDSKTGKMSFFSSEDDTSLNYQHNKETKIEHNSTDEGLLLSDTNSNLLLTKSPESRAYSSSSEDLLSIEDSHPKKKKDNTLISKIYMEPNVRSFAQGRRNVPATSTPVKENKPVPRENEVFEKLNNNHSLPVYSSDDSLPHAEKIITNGRRATKVETSNEFDPDVNEIEKRHVVRSVLGQFSKSYSNLSDINRSQPIEIIEGAENGELRMSVKDLRKKFECNNGKNIVISSLTARSVPKQVRENLKQ